MKNLNLLFNLFLFPFLFLGRFVFSQGQDNYSHRGRGGFQKGIKTLIFLPFLLFSTLYAKCANPKEFSLAFKTVAKGDIKLIGNTNICKPDSNGNCIDPGNTANNHINAIWRDGDSVSSTENSSSAKLELSDNAEVLWAGLYWQGYFSGTLTNTLQQTATSVKLGYSTDNANLNINYTDIKADRLNHVYFSNRRWYYQGFKDITNYVKTHKKGWYWGANVKTTLGKPPGGTLGAWSIAIAYKDDTKSTKNLSIYDGYLSFAGTNDINKAKKYAQDNSCPVDNTGLQHEFSIPLSGFLTPKAGKVDSTLLFFAGEGDIGLSGDNMYLADKSGTFHQITNSVNPKDNIANSSISENGVLRSSSLLYPYYGYNTIGIDIDTFNVSDIMEHSQNETAVKMNTSGDGYFPGLFGLSIKLYTPDICYDYTYGQNGIFVTAPDVTHPSIDGTFNKNTPINVKLYFQNQENSDISISNLKVNIDPIDTQKAKYTGSNIYVMPPGGTKTITTPESSAENYIRRISIGNGNLGSLDYFYTYYSLDANVSDISNMRINATLEYNLAVNVGGSKIDLGTQTNSIQSMHMCTSNVSYEPIPGRFNVVQAGEAKSTDPYYYFNIPTQVVNRVGATGDFKIESMNPADTNHSKILTTATMVSAQLVDMNGFHYTTATCTDPDIAVTQSHRVWTLIDANTAFGNLDQTAMKNALFFSNASSNSAFRLSYNLADDNVSAISLEEVGNHKPAQYKLTNFTAIAGSSCSSTFTGNGGVSANCGSNGSGNGNNGMDQSELATCMECIFGKNTKSLCSRDNFAIRPEAFMMQLDDQNQTNPTVQASITTLSNSGDINASAPIFNLAAGYDYHLKAIAVNHLNNSPSQGYYKTMNLDGNNPAVYRWRGAKPSGACNDESNKTLENKEEVATNQLYFSNGSVDVNTSINQVGEYTMTMIDNTWTAVDNDPNYYTHHVGTYFRAGDDCQENASYVVTENNTSLNGCNISSSHTNADNKYRYNDYNVIIHPYKFDLNGAVVGNPITPSIGLNGDAITTTSYVYMADIYNSQDENMSYHLNGSIVALGEDNSTLSNFVDKCYATPLDINITTTNRELNDTYGNHVDYKIRLHDINSTNNILTALDINVTETNTTIQTNDIQIQTLQTTTKGYFQKNQNGRMETRLSLNYDRKKDKAVNPISIKFIKYKVNCSNAIADCTFNADLNSNKTTQGTKDLNATIPIIHYYGRTHAPRQKFTTPVGTATKPAKAFIYYEIYCDGATCDKTLLPDGNNSKTSDDPRWFINTQHTLTDGSALNVSQKAASDVTTQTNPSGNAPDFTEIYYEGSKGYPYKTTMENNPSGWLIYNKYNPSATTNEFQVEFINGSAGWSGAHETNTSSVNGGTSITNRRVMW